MKEKNNIAFNTVDYILIATILFLLIAAWCYVIIEYKNLPDTIATHFNGAGNPDGFSPKNSIWLAPTIFTALSVGLIFGAKNPQQLSFPYKKMSKKEKKSSSKVLLCSSLLLSSLLILILHSMIKTSINFTPNNNSMSWVLKAIFSLLGGFIIVVAYYQLKNYKT